MESKVFGLIAKEQHRQDTTIELIASENFVSENIMRAVGSCLTNKYSEGYPATHRSGSRGRYYGGCQYVDELEEYCCEMWQKVFQTNYHVNVQPHSGTNANIAAYLSVLKPGDTILSMSLDNGGHLSHGSPVNISGKIFNFIHYGANKSGWIDTNDFIDKLYKFNPKLVVIGASAYSRTLYFDTFRNVIDCYRGQTGNECYMLVDMAHIAGLVAAGLHPSPIPYADVTTTTTHKTLRGPRGGLILSSEETAKKFNFNKAIFPGTQGGPLMHVIAAKAVCFKEALSDDFKIYAQGVIDNAQALCSGLTKRGIRIVSGKTENHLMLVDLTNLGKTGKEAENLLDEVNITCNKNTIPNDPKSAFVTSGVRLGTAAVTSRGMNTEDMDVIAEAIAIVLKEEENAAKRAKALVKGLTEKYPLI